jgi:hypothetical protein
VKGFIKKRKEKAKKDLEAKYTPTPNENEAVSPKNDIMPKVGEDGKTERDFEIPMEDSDEVEINVRVTENKLGSLRTLDGNINIYFFLIFLRESNSTTENRWRNCR